MRFASPDYLYLLIIPFVILLLYVFTQWNAKRRIKRYASPQLFWRLVNNYSSVRMHFKFALLLVALTLTIIMLARPQYGMVKEVKTKKGIEAVIALDVSYSMLATDVSPNRMERSKEIVNNLSDCNVQILADNDRLEQVFVNLIENAIK